MIYYAALALIGFACAIAFRWSVMFCIAALVFVACFTVLVLRGTSLGIASVQAIASFVVLQLCYVLGGAALGLRLRRTHAKKNLKA